MGELDRMVVGQQMCAWREYDVLGPREGLGDHQVGSGAGLPRRCVVLANPGLAEAQLVEGDQVVEIPLESLADSTLGRVGRHYEGTEFHRILAR